MVTKRIKYRGWIITFDDADGLYRIYSPDELENPVGFRSEEAELGTLKQAKTFINHYNDY